MKQTAMRSSCAISGIAGLCALLAVAAPPSAVAATLADLPTAAQEHGPEAVGLALAGAGCWVALAWLALAVVVSVAASRPGRCGQVARGIAAVTVPPAVRRMLAVGVGLAVVTAATGPALAAGPPTQRTVVAGTLAGALPGAPGSFDWPLPQSQPPNRPRPSTAVAIVRPGDTLWAIARRHLPAGAGDAAIAAAWPRWYAANRSVIGPDPDLLLPGQRLVPPSNPTGGSS